MTTKCEDVMKPYIRHFLSVALTHDRIGMGPVVSDALEKLENNANDRAETVRTPEMISVFCFSEKHQILLQVREWVLKYQIENILEVKRCMEALERAMKQHIIPMETIEAINLAIRCPGDYDCVSDAWSKLKQYAHAQKLLDHFNIICNEASELAMHPEGIEEHQLLDVKIHIYWAKSTPLCGISDKALQNAEALARKLEGQLDVKQELSNSISRRSIEPLRKAIQYAERKGNCTHLRAYRLAKDILEDLTVDSRLLAMASNNNEDTFLNRIANQFNSTRVKRLSMHLKMGTWELNNSTESPRKKNYFETAPLDVVCDIENDEDANENNFHDSSSRNPVDKDSEMARIGEDPWSMGVADDDEVNEVDSLPLGKVSEPLTPGVECSEGARSSHWWLSGNSWISAALTAPSALDSKGRST